MREDWLKERKKGIGGSDAPVVCGVSPWKTPYHLYLEKRGELSFDKESEDNEPMFWGRTLEPVIRQRYADVTGRTVVVPKNILVHPKYDWMIASLDGMTTDNRVVEIKTARSPIGWGEDGTDEIPDIYMIQVQHYLSVTKVDIADVAALIAGSDFRIYEIRADKELQDLIIEREASFWEGVKMAIPPDPVSFDDIKRKYGSISKAVAVQADQETINLVLRLKELKKFAQEEEICKAQIMAYMKEADTLMAGDEIISTWKLGKGQKRFDAKAFQAEHPDLYEKFIKEGDPIRRFLLK